MKKHERNLSAYFRYTARETFGKLAFAAVALVVVPYGVGTEHLSSLQRSTARFLGEQSVAPNYCKLGSEDGRYLVEISTYKEAWRDITAVRSADDQYPVFASLQTRRGVEESGIIDWVKVDEPKYVNTTESCPEGLAPHLQKKMGVKFRVLTR